MNATLPDASPLTDDLDDLTLHEPVTKENDMNGARASERADLVELLKALRMSGSVMTTAGEHVLRAELSRASATASASKLCTKCHGLKTYCTHCNELGLEPAATASRTVSEQEVLAMVKALPLADDSALILRNAHDRKAFFHKILRESGKRLIPAPSVAEPAKCVHDGGECGVGGYCPDCTPASAEQKCACGNLGKPCDKFVPSNRPDIVVDTCTNTVMNGTLFCMHSRACHADEVKP